MATQRRKIAPQREGQRHGGRMGQATLCRRILRTKKNVIDCEIHNTSHIRDKTATSLTDLRKRSGYSSTAAVPNVESKYANIGILASGIPHDCSPITLFFIN